jgi:CheY-like chemotaxis protein/anti-sigma regulatory factor (Ser/Thr protein kinase)
MVDTILECSNQMMKLVDNLLNIAEFEGSSLKLHSTEFHPHKILVDMVQFFRHQEIHGQIKLISQISSRLPLTLIGDPDRIQQVLFELVDNAVRFTGSGFVRLRAFFQHGSVAQGFLTVCVRDSGPGIPHYRQKEIFEPFIQVDGSSCRVFGGAGLGLAKVQRLVKLMGGQVSVRSIEGKGSVFTVKIPVLMPGDYILGGSKTPCALIAEDNLQARFVLQRMLERAGWTVELAGNGLEAVNLISRRRFDLVFMDIEMPVLSGLDAVRIIRRKELEEGAPHSVICAVTAYALPGDREKYLAAGMDEYLSKPLHMKELAAIIKKYIPVYTEASG